MTLVPANSRGANAVSSVFGRTGVVAAANGDYNGVVASALTGATAATRYVGGTASGAPVSGTFAVGDFVIDQTAKIYVCTVLGTPGTWVQVGAGGGGFTVGSSYIRCNTAGQTGLASGNFVYETLTLGSVVGADLAIDGGDNTKLNVLTTGWYSVMYQNDASPAAANTFTDVDAAVETPGFGLIYNGGLETTATINFWEWVLTFPPAPFTAGDFLKGRANMTTSLGGTWSLDGVNDVLVAVRLS